MGWWKGLRLSSSVHVAEAAEGVVGAARGVEVGACAVGAGKLLADEGHTFSICRMTAGRGLFRGGLGVCPHGSETWLSYDASDPRGSGA
jgi:hypothetical protein